MNVRCPECSTEFVLDEAQIPPGGLQLQCTTCNAVFNAQVPSPHLPPPKDDGEWMIRQPNGNLFRLRELTTLQRWIVERKVGRDDEISRTGQKWERLGNIAELSAFFQAVETVNPPHLAQPIASSPPVQAPVPESAPPAPRATTTATAPAVPTGSVLENRAAWEDSPQAPPRAPETGQWEMVSGPDGFDDDEDDLALRPKRRGWLWVALVFLLAGGAGAFYATQPDTVNRFIERLSGKTPPELLAKVDRAYLDLMPDTVEAFEAARTRLESLREAHPSLVQADVALAEVHLARAHHARRHRAVLAALPGPEAEAQATIALPEPEVTKLLDQAGELLRDSATAAAKLPAATRAMMELQRLRGNRDAAEKLLVELRALPNAEDHRWTALLIAELEDDTGALQSLVERVPALIRARVDLAWAHYRAEDAEGALERARAVLEASPHPTARALVDGIARADEAAPAADEDEEAPEEDGEAPVAKEDEGPSFERLLAMAERARRADRAERALVLYERALELEPDDIEALSGMGFSYIDLDKGAAATATFRRVLQLNERFSPAHMGLAEAYRLRDMKRDALEHYRRYLELVPNGPDAPVAKRMIKELSP